MLAKISLLLALPSVGLAGIADCVPARWPSSDPRTLAIVRGGPVNCLLVERDGWSKAFVETAARMSIRTLGVVRKPVDLVEASRTAAELGLAALVLEGDFESKDIGLVQKTLPAVMLSTRERMFSAAGAEVIGTTEAVWPHLRVTGDDGKAAAGPTGAPWIDTNTGFLRFARSLDYRPIWLGNAPPEGRIVTTRQYLMSLIDAATMGAAWIIAFDKYLATKLLAGRPEALVTWQQLCDYVRFFYSEGESAGFEAGGEFVLIEDAKDGGLQTGGLLDMIASRHTPVRVVPASRLSDRDLRNARIIMNLRGPELAPPKHALLSEAARKGAVLLAPPAGWHFPTTGDYILQIDALSKWDIEQVESLWNSVTIAAGRRNLGARVFNGAGMLSRFQVNPSGSKARLALINYTDYPVDSITVYFETAWPRIRLARPGETPRELRPYPLEDQEGCGVEIDKIDRVALLLAEK